MFVLRSTHAALRADYVRVLEQRDTFRREAQAARTTTRIAAGQFTNTDDALGRARLARIRDAVRYGARIDRLCRAVAQLRAENAQLRRQVAQLHAAYDHAVGLDNPSLDLGAHWQERRSDKPRAKAVTS